MKQKTTWRPDTCQCEITYEWDDTLPEALRTHTATEVKLCDAHKTAPTPSAAFATLMDENQRKNFAWVEIVSRFAASKEEDFSFSYDANRVLQINMIGTSALSGAQKTTLQNALNTRFGSGKVTVK